MRFRWFISTNLIRLHHLDKKKGDQQNNIEKQRLHSSISRIRHYCHSHSNCHLAQLNYHIIMDVRDNSMYLVYAWKATHIHTHTMNENWLVFFELCKWHLSCFSTFFSVGPGKIVDLSTIITAWSHQTIATKPQLSMRLRDLLAYKYAIVCDESLFFIIIIIGFSPGLALRLYSLSLTLWLSLSFSVVS